MISYASNKLLPSFERLADPLVSSQNCAFCFIGQKDIFSAIDEVTRTYNTLHFQVEYRPYNCHPSIKPGHPQDRAAHYSQAFGEERSLACRKKMKERFRELGLEL